MSNIVSLENVTKRYGDMRGIEDVTVDFEEGKVTGFLGLNGAGKTTTMKIITTYFKPNSGKVYVNSIDAIQEPYKVRKFIGYLPENFPIYDNLTVLDFLKFVALSKEVPNVEEEVEKVINQVGVEKYKNRFLKELSKGYRQRVGIAQAIIGDPKVIILDEPTQGLDPAQIIEIRKLIKSLSANRTIILSTHIMQEVEAICDNLVIIHEGKIRMSGRVKDLKEQIQNEVKVEYIFSKTNNEINDKIREILKSYNIHEVQFQDSSVTFNINKKDERILFEISKKLVEDNIEFLYINKNTITMEDLFLKAIQ
ncbi:MAG: ATP-binding cassette domain-containing protein [bacterium]